MASPLTSRRILVGVTGGIAAYKSADLVRRLREAGAEVRVAMTPNATRFVTALTLQAVSGHPVHDRLLDADAESGMGHIDLARWADAVLVAPASANFLARLAHGFANDLLSTLCLATEAPLAVAPAMNRLMWANARTRGNVERLREDGVLVLGPGEGDQACGEIGPGRMLEPAELVTGLGRLFREPLLEGVRVMVTAGPTWEAIDPVRGLTNLSSGRMGYAVAEAARDAGAAVTLVAGPTGRADPRGVSVHHVLSAQDMRDAVMAGIAGQDIFVAVAAVADYRPQSVAGEKMKKTGERMTIELVRNPDILAEVAARPGAPFTVGFAAETGDVEQYARAKLSAKNLDMVAANRVGMGDAADPGSPRRTLGFGAAENSLLVIDRDGAVELPDLPKPALAGRLIDLIAERYRARRPAQDPRSAAGA